MRGIHWWPVNSPHKGPVMWKMFSFDDIIMKYYSAECSSIEQTDTWIDLWMYLPMMMWCCMATGNQLSLVIIPSASTKLKGGYTGFTLSVCPSLYEEDKNYPIWRRQERRSKYAVQLASWQLRSNSPKTSVCPSVRLWTESCPFCIFVNNTYRIHFIFAHLIKQLKKVCRVWCPFQN